MGKIAPVTLNVHVYVGQMLRYPEFSPFGVNPAAQPSYPQCS